MAGIRKIVAFRPDRHAFVAKVVWTGIKLAKTPIEEPPIIAPPRMNAPIHLRVFADVAPYCKSSSSVVLSTYSIFRVGVKRW
jgi:hypothetical protein